MAGSSATYVHPWHAAALRPCAPSSLMSEHRGRTGLPTGEADYPRPASG